MHKLPYEPPREGAGDSRRLARWAAAWTLVVFGMMGVDNLVSVVSTGLGYTNAIVLTAFVEKWRAVGYAISGLSVPLAVAAFGVWLVTGRVVVWLLASVPLAFGAGGGLSTLGYIAEYGVYEWSLLVRWLPVSAGYIVLGLLFLTRTLRLAVNAPRHRPAGAGA